MTLEWLRRHDPVLDQQMRTYLFTAKPVTDIEHGAEPTVTATPVPGPPTGPSASAA